MTPAGSDDAARLAPSDEDLARLERGEHDAPHDVLGPHSVEGGGRVVRAWRPDARTATWISGGRESSMTPLGRGLFVVALGEAPEDAGYRLRFELEGGRSVEQEDPYRFGPTVADEDLSKLAAGEHRRLWRVLGAQPRTHEGVEGVGFAVWAPRAVRVSWIGEEVDWDGRVRPMRRLGGSGVFEIFVPGLQVGAAYKFQVLAPNGELRHKADPYARHLDDPPECASRVVRSDYRFGDAAWWEGRRGRDPRYEALSVYEVHLGSWARGDDDEFLGYREIAPFLVDHVKRLGFTHVELLPVMEHALYSSWGYLTTGYFAPTSRYGGADDLKFLIDQLHAAGIGVILDWVPAHFPRDDFALRLFDGTPQFEYEDPRRAEHPEWGTLVFDYQKPQVRDFLVSNALYWLEEFHVDGLRVDAVASILYHDYGRRDGEWLPNAEGGRESSEGIEFLRALNEAIREELPDRFTVAEESTTFPGVTASVAGGGLGFQFKWNMGWMHDTLKYLGVPPDQRGEHQSALTFPQMYEESERFVMPLSHDEVVHEKRPLLGKMAGDDEERFANLRLLLALQFTRPGKKLLFMGTELAPETEWNHDVSLDWSLSEDPRRAAFERLLVRLASFYRARPALWARDPEPDGFEWIDCDDTRNSVISYVRHAEGRRVVVVLNFGATSHPVYEIGAPTGGLWRVVLSTDDRQYGGRGTRVPRRLRAKPRSTHGRDHTLVLRLPALTGLVLLPDGEGESHEGAPSSTSGARRRRPPSGGRTVATGH